MNLSEILPLINAKVICGTELEKKQVDFGFTSDLMSDVLTIHCDNLLLITGLSNLQTIRTCEMLDIKTILLVRNKKASPDMIELAEENEMVILESEYSMYRVAGILYQAGIKPVF